MTRSVVFVSPFSEVRLFTRVDIMETVLINGMRVFQRSTAYWNLARFAIWALFSPRYACTRSMMATDRTLDLGMGKKGKIVLGEWHVFPVVAECSCDGLSEVERVALLAEYYLVEEK